MTRLSPEARHSIIHSVGGGVADTRKELFRKVRGIVNYADRRKSHLQAIDQSENQGGFLGALNRIKHVALMGLDSFQIQLRSFAEINFIEFGKIHQLVKTDLLPKNSG